MAFFKGSYYEHILLFAPKETGETVFDGVSAARDVAAADLDRAVDEQTILSPDEALAAADAALAIQASLPAGEARQEGDYFVIEGNLFPGKIYPAH